MTLEPSEQLSISNAFLPIHRVSNQATQEFLDKLKEKNFLKSLSSLSFSYGFCPW